VIAIAPVTGSVDGAAALDASVRRGAETAFTADGGYAIGGGPAAYRLDTEVVELATSGHGPLVLSCKLNVTISREPDHAMVGVASASANVGTDAADLENAKRDCVRTLMESLVHRRILPSLDAALR
jgi:hypothetical protein